MRFPLVIVEGCDGAGKTTLIQGLDKVPNIPQIFRIHRSRRPKSEMEVVNEMVSINSLVHGQRVPVVLDRHALISEPIYGTIVRNKPVVFWDADAVPEYLLEDHTLIIYCRPTTEAVKACIGNNPQMEGVLAKVEDILLAYDLRMTLLRNRGANVRPYNYQEESSLSLWQEVYGV